MPVPAIFLDRDGTITADTGYTHRLDELEFVPNAIDGLVKLRELGWPFVVVTNQGGIGLGKFTEQQLDDYNAEIARRLAEFDLAIRAWYHSPFHPRAIRPQYQGESDCRKPAPGMLTRAAAELGLDLNASWMIGDRISDVQAGQRAGCRAVLVRTGPEPIEVDPSAPPDADVPDLLAAAEFISKAIRPVR